MVLRFLLLAMLTALLVCGAAAQSNPPQPVQLTPDVSQGFLIHRVLPSYPPAAREAHVQGTVVLHAAIGKYGLVEDLQVISGHPLLNQAALDAVKLWRFKPYLLDGEPVPVQTTMSVTFELDGSESEVSSNAWPANSSSVPPQTDDSDLKPYTSCDLGPEFQIVQVDGPVKDFSWPTKTKNGEVSIPVETGFRVLVTYRETEPFGNLKVERLPKSQYIDEKANLLSTLAYLSAQPDNDPNVQTESRNGLTTYGISRNKLEGGTLSIYEVFLDGESVAVSMYLLNAESAARKFSTLDEYKKIRDRFLDAYTKCLAPSRNSAPAEIRTSSQTPPNETSANSSSSEGGNSSRPSATQTGQNTSGQDPGVHRVGGRVIPPKVIYAPDAQYSQQARNAHYEGRVVLWLVVDTDGLPQNIRVERPLGMGLDEEAIKAVKQWRFKPGKKDGKPVPVMINIEVNFRL